MYKRVLRIITTRSRIEMARARYWMFTINNPSFEDYPTKEEWQFNYCVYQLEKGENGTPHLQGYVQFAKTKRLSAVKKINGRAHWEPRKGSHEQAVAYCTKEDTREAEPVELGEPTYQGQRNDIHDCTKMVMDGAEWTDVIEEHPVAVVKYHKGLCFVRAKTQPKYEHDTVRGIWIWGPPGTGKSHTAREMDPDAYIKAQNKWFDGYEGEKTIILDDLDTAMLGHHLKIWMDRYHCAGEFKGGTVNLRHTKFIVTSNFSIEQLFKDDEVLQQAIRRRCKVIYKGTVYRENMTVNDRLMGCTQEERTAILKLKYPNTYEHYMMQK